MLLLVWKVTWVRPRLELNRSVAVRLVEFVREVVQARGKIKDNDLASIRRVGYKDAEVIAIITAAAYYTFTNMINNVFETEVDFPKVEVAVGMLDVERETDSPSSE